MSPTIWTRCGGEANLAPLATECWRIVAGHPESSTRKLVDSEDERRLLDDLIDRVRPPVPPEPEFSGLHDLLAAPFRIPPLRHGSRFGSRAERGIWYGGEALTTALAEAAYYRFLFLEGTVAALWPVFADVTAFSARVATPRGVDLTTKAFTRFQAEISSPVSYEVAQAMGRELRAAGVEAFRFRSARDPEGDSNLGLFTPRAFAARCPTSFQLWLTVADRGAVEFIRHDPLQMLSVRFTSRQFQVDGRLPAPAQ